MPPTLAAAAARRRLRRRALREEPQETILGQPVQYLTFENTCDNVGVDFRLHFSFGECVPPLLLLLPPLC